MVKDSVGGWHYLRLHGSHNIALDRVATNQEFNFPSDTTGMLHVDAQSLRELQFQIWEITSIQTTLC